MKPVRILVDSTVDLPERCRAQVRAVPLTVHFGDEELIDGVTIDRRRFYERLIESDVLPTTSQATPAAFVKEFEAVRQAGESAVVITISAELSGTYQSACIAAADYEDIYVVDSRSAAIGSGILAELALEWAADGMAAAELAGLDTLPVIVREMTDDAAVILMVDSNLQRENILPSERAFAYKMKLEALKNQGARSDLTSCQVGTKFRADESLAEDTGGSARNVQRFIRLTNLIPELLDLVDEKKISFNPAVELSYLDEAQQRDFLQAMDETQNAPSLSQAQRMKKLTQEGKFTYEAAFAIMGEAKKDELDKVVIKNDTLKKYFPRSYTPRQMEDVIIKLLEQWQRRQQRQNER